MSTEISETDEHILFTGISTVTDQETVLGAVRKFSDGCWRFVPQAAHPLSCGQLVELSILVSKQNKGRGVYASDN